MPVGQGSFAAIKSGKKMRPLLTWLDTRVPDLEIGHKKSLGGSPEFWIYLDTVCVGFVTFRYSLVSVSRPSMVKWFPAKIKFAQPHSTMLPIIRGKGYASFIYEVAMRSGIVLYAWEHTEAASKLWESLARKTGAKIYQFDTVTKTFVTKNSENTVKVLSLIKPAYRG